MTSKIRLTPTQAALVCIAIGCALLACAWFARTAVFAEFIFSHSGVAFLVGGMVGIGYEMRADRARFNDHIETLKQAAKDLATLKLPDLLNALFPSPTEDGDLRSAELKRSHDSIRLELSELIAGMLAIEREESRNNVLLSFVEKLMWYASEAAKTLSNKDTTGPGRKLRLPRTAAQLAAEILSTQMEALEGNESYCVISDFTTWSNDELDKFSEAMGVTLAKSNQVTVRRMFAHFGHDDSMELSRATAILKQHYAVAVKYQRYELAVSVEASYPHIGIFQCTGVPPICFKPGEGGDLSEIEFLRSDESKKFQRGWLRAVNVRVESKKNKKRVALKPFEDWISEINKENPQFWTRFINSAPS